MYVVSGVPIHKGIPVDELSYYTIRDVHQGDIVEAPVRGVQRPLLVTRVEEVPRAKATLRAQDFALQKMGPNAPVPILLPELLHALELASKETLVHKGTLLKTCIPSFVLEDKEALRRPRRASSHFVQIPLQAGYADRLAHYKNTIRESFARGESVFIMVPTREDVLGLSAAISPGIAQYVVPMHGGLSKREVHKNWKHALEEEHTVVVVATPTFISLPRHDLGTIICEREGDDAYVRIERPHVDMRIVAKAIAEALRAQYIVGDSVLTAQTLAQVDMHAIDTPLPLTTKVHGGTISLLHYVKNDQETHTTKTRSPLDSRCVAAVGAVVRRGGTVLIVAPRRGLATTLICSDCGTKAACTECGGGYRLHTKRTDDMRVLSCGRCGHESSPNTTCATCGSWKIASLGFGDEMLYDLFAHALPEVPVYAAPTAHTKDLTTPGVHIILPTHLWQTSRVDLVLIPSLEALLSVPTADADLNTARLLARAREVAQETLVHTRTRDVDARVRSIVEGQLAEVVRNDLDMRAQLRMPPYVHTVDVTVVGSKIKVMKDARTVIDTLHAYTPKPEPEMVRRSPTQLSHTTRLTLPVGPFPEDLRAKLHSLPLTSTITVQ